MSADLIDILRRGVEAQLALTFLGLLGTGTFLLLSLVALDVVCDVFGFGAGMIPAVGGVVVEEAAGTEVVLDFLFAVRAAIDDGIARVHRFLVKSIMALFAVDNEILLLAVVADPRRAHGFAQQVETYRRTA